MTIVKLWPSRNIISSCLPVLCRSYWTDLLHTFTRCRGVSILPKLIGYHSNISWVSTKLTAIYNPDTHVYQCWKAGEDWSNTCWDVVEYVDFCSLVQKVVTLAIPWVTRPIVIKLAHDVATILPLNIFDSELLYSYPFLNASLSNFAKIWFPWGIGKWGPDRSSTNQYLSFGEKNVKIGPVDLEIIGLWAIIKRRKKSMQAKLTALLASLPWWVNNFEFFLYWNIIIYLQIYIISRSIGLFSTTLDELENCPQSRIKVPLTVFGHWLLKFNLGLWPWPSISGELWLWPMHMQQVNVSGHLVQKL